MRRLTGWLFDVYAQGDGVSVWLIDDDGVAHHLRDHLRPSFFVGGSVAELRRVCEWITRAHLPARLTRAERYDVFAHRNLVVLQVQVQIPGQFSTIVQRIASTFPALDFYNADISIAQFYFFEHNLFPLAYCDVLVDDARAIVEITTDDSRWALEYRIPPLRGMFIQLEGGALNPNHGHRAPLEITYDDRTYVIEHHDRRAVIERVRDYLLRFDPDVIVSRWGDSFILPQLFDEARRYRVPLPFNRDPQCKPVTRPARSYFSYGRIIHKTMSHTLFGRWHIDLENSSLLDYGLDGAVEVARLTQQPMQQTVRVSTGTGISAMQVSTAYHKGYLIPFHKSEPEEFKSASALLTSDKGGLTYQPIVGLHFDVAELDFASMYPAIMARFNVSPETIHCRCCPNSRVPEIGYSICRRERGLVPETLAPLIEKRLAYKQRLKQATSEQQKEFYRRRTSAHKWLLVTCFGYLGYKNARFGKIEAHEAVTAYGREVLLRAKDIVEARGFRVLHALTDSLWIRKKGTTEAEYARLAEEIARATNLPIELEGVYKWVAFLPSRVNPHAGVPNRYFGALPDGELKIRGIEARRGDTPEFIKRAQLELLAEIAQASTRAEFAARLPRCLEMVAARVDALRAGQVPLQDLAFTYRLSREPREYATNTLNAIVAWELAGRGIKLDAGESIRYVVTDYKAAVPSDRARSTEFLDGSWGYDVERYTEIFLRAVETILTPLGVNVKMLQDWLAKELPVQPLRARIEHTRAREYLGPLFEFAIHRQTVSRIAAYPQSPRGGE
jgi:DNA polymerase-2